MTAGFSSTYTSDPTSFHGKYDSKDIIIKDRLNTFRVANVKNIQ